MYTPVSPLRLPRTQTAHDNKLAEPDEVYPCAHTYIRLSSERRSLFSGSARFFSFLAVVIAEPAELVLAIAGTRFDLLEN